ncbi:MAG: hypothetical protein WKG07_32655 [Hymenobacter sp.]
MLLCENQHYLLQWQKAMAQEIELRYAGGNNTRKLAHAPDPGGAFCYCGDWDYAGLRIYRDVYAIRLLNHGRRARLLTPPPDTKKLRVGIKNATTNGRPTCGKSQRIPLFPWRSPFTNEQRTD